jgi:hypothetical protein
MEAEETHNWAHKAKDTFEDARARADTWDERIREFAREKPLAAVFCAVLGGYTLARLSNWWR